MNRILAIACTLLGAGCWVYRGGPNYQYEPVSAAHAWTIQPELRQHSFWHLSRTPLRYRTDVWRYRSDMLVLEVHNTGNRAERVRIGAAAGATAAPRVFAGLRDDSKSLREIVPHDAWIDVPEHATVNVRVMLEQLRSSPRAQVGDRIRFRIEDSSADPGPVEFDFLLARIWRDYACIPVIGD